MWRADILLEAGEEVNVVIAAGGTGGHVYPAMALAEEFCSQDSRSMVTFVGTGRSLEHSILSQGDFTVVNIKAQGVVGRGCNRAIMALLLLPRAIWQALRLLRARGAQLVIVTGGYAAPPVMIAAWLLGLRRFILEPNAMPGLANRVTGPLAHRIFLAFESAKPYFNPSRAQVVGIPLRKSFVTQPLPPLPLKVHTLVIFGGSQGAQAINSAMMEALALSRPMRETLNVIHQTGQEDYERIRKAYKKRHLQATVSAFLFDMPTVLRKADLVIARAGAVTLAELAAYGKPSLLIPFPHATHQHQEKNARTREAANAAIVVPQAELTGHRLVDEIEHLMSHPDHLHSMARNSLAQRQTDAARIIVQECRRLCGSVSETV